jgi:hypothetical protein
MPVSFPNVSAQMRGVRVTLQKATNSRYSIGKNLRAMELTVPEPSIRRGEIAMV